MVDLDANMLRQLQLVELELLLEVDRVCQKHGIRYCIIAGTMLGAERHGGFIPWDDDADVAMLRADYERFREACRTELDPDKYYFQDHRATDGYRWGYGKLRRVDTVFTREYQEHMPYDQGVFIDVFPLDAVPEGYAGRAAANFACFCVRKMLWAPVGRYADKNPAMRAWYSVLAQLPSAIPYGLLNGMAHFARHLKSRWVRILMYPTPNNSYGYLKEWYTTPKPATFEGHVFPGVSDPRGYLSFKFGDYLALPPVEQRKTHPVSSIKLVEPQV